MDPEQSRLLAASTRPNLSKQSVWVGRKIILDTLIKPLSDTALLYAIAFVSG